MSCILNCSIDTLLGGYTGTFRRRITVGEMRQAIHAIRHLRDLLGAEHFMYRTMADALDQQMHSSIEAAFSSINAEDAYVCESLLACIEAGDYVDVHDVRRNISNEKARNYTLHIMQEVGLK